MRGSVCPSLNRVWSIAPILFEVGILNLVCGYILGSLSVTYCFQVAVTLTSGLNSRKIVSGAYPKLFEVGISYSVCGYTLGSPSVAYCFRVTMTLTSAFNSRKIVSEAYLLYCLR